MRKTKLAISMIINMLIAVLVFFAVRYYFVRTGSGNMQVSGAVCFRYFTILSNVFCALAALILVVFEYLYLDYNIDIPRWVLVLKYISSVSVAITFTTCVVFLGPLLMSMGESYFSLFSDNNLTLHLIVPVLSIASTILLEPNPLTIKKSYYGLISIYLYSLVYCPLVLVGIWPDFYGFTFGGKLWVVPISIVMMYGLSLLLSSVILKLQKRNGAKR